MNLTRPARPSTPAAKPSPAPIPSGRRFAAGAASVAGAALVVATGAIHLHLWADGYRHVPTIGGLFLLQGISGLILGVLTGLSHRLLVILAAIGFLAASIAGLLLAVHVGLFGFHDSLAAPWAATSLAVEIAGVIALAVGGLLAGRGGSASARGASRTA